MLQIKPNIYFITLTFTILLIAPKLGSAQEHVFTNNISRSIVVAKRNITIKAEKANIYITEATDDKFIIELKLISKHSNKIVAEKQLNYLKHNLKIKPREILLQNSIVVSNDDELTGIVQAEYTLKIPKNKTVSISNSLGKLEINQIEGNFTINTKYGNSLLSHVKGTLNLNANIGELVLKNCDLNGKLETKYLSSYFQICKGSYNITPNLGSLNFGLNKYISKLEVNASGTEVILSNKNCNEFNFDLFSLYGNIFLDDCNLPYESFIQKDIKDASVGKREIVYINPQIKSTVTIKNKYANISIQ